VNNVLGIPLGFTLVGKVNTNDFTFDVAVNVTLGPYGSSSDWGVCVAYWSAGGTFNVRIFGSPSAPSITVGASMSLAAGCGSVGVSLGGAAQFSYTPPSTVHLHVYLVLGFGSLGSWEPTIIDV
jgi:hypothetical protein